MVYDFHMVILVCSHTQGFFDPFQIFFYSGDSSRLSGVVDDLTCCGLEDLEMS